ncbi:hypothetical protein KEM54_005280 [Ascosphaera aggregata]|nr:hypothetical protein KEM54_005280 [Ascosphaera aggregata]
MFAPPLVPVPPSDLRQHLSEIEWEGCLQAWIRSIEIRLRLSRDEFVQSMTEDSSSVSSSSQRFLTSYLKEAPLFPPTATSNRQLKRLIFQFSRRILLDLPSMPLQKFLNWPFISSFIQFYGSSRTVQSLFSDLWSQHGQLLSACIEQGKALSISQLSSRKQGSECPWSNIRLLSLILCFIPEAGQALMIGSDYIDTLFETYREPTSSTELKNGIVANLYVGICSLITMQPPQTSLLLDQLYSIKTSAIGQKEPNLLSDLICSTDVLSRLEAVFLESSQTRGRNLISSLQTYQNQCRGLHQLAPFMRRAKKGKKLAIGVDGSSKNQHVSQVKELFPGLEDEYVHRLLDHYSDDVEVVVARLLDHSVSPDLRSEPSVNAPSTTEDHLAQGQSRALSNVASKEPERRNIFDNDDFDRLNIPPSKLKFGRSKKKITADDLLQDRSDHAQRKAAVLSALATFDSDDDERDDTYDIADVGGSVDAVTSGLDTDVKPVSATTTAAGTAALNDLELYRHYKKNEAAFGRGSDVRRSSARTELRNATGMTDEAIEGWAIMLKRDTKRSARLDQTLLMESGVNKPAVGTSEADETEDNRSSVTAGTRDEERGGGRGRGGGGDHRGNRGKGNREKQQNNPKPTRDGSNAGNRGGSSSRGRSGRSRGTHDRRNQHAKKMARAGMGAPE